MANYRKITLHGGPRDGETFRYLGTPAVVVTAETVPATAPATMTGVRYHDYRRRPGTCDYDYCVPAAAAEVCNRSS